MKTVVFDIETSSSDLNPEQREAVNALAVKREVEYDQYVALCPALCRVVAVGMRTLVEGATYGDRVVYDSELLDAPDNELLRGQSGEAALLEDVVGVLHECQRFVTFNGRSFDWPVLLHRCTIHGIRVPWMRAIASEYRYKPERNIDLLDLFTGHGSSPRYPLAAYAIGYGLQNPKAGGGGEQVHELVRKRDGASVCRYVLGDVRATAGLFRKWMGE